MPLPAMNEILSVTDITRSIKLLLERAHPSVTIRGEISNLRYQSSGHIYFTLKDDAAQIKGVVFASNARLLKVRLQEGQSVVGTGRLAVYEPQGSYQIIFQNLTLDGKGQLHAAFEQLKLRLQQEGLFDSQRKRPIPQWPARVAVFTSASGAVVRDICSVLQRRGWLGEISVIPVRVQGSGAGADIAAALDWAEGLRYFDLFVLARGGGSLEDLWPFNEEVLVRRVAACNTPVISAVGHETDFTLCDFAADWRAETPTAAADLLCRNLQAFIDAFANAKNSLLYFSRNHWQQKLQAVDFLRMRLEAQSPQMVLHNWRQRLEVQRGRLLTATNSSLATAKLHALNWQQRLQACHPVRRIELERRSLTQLHARLHSAVARSFDQCKKQLSTYQRQLNLLSADNVLQRGFALVLNQQGNVIESTAAAKTGEALLLRLKDGTLRIRNDGPAISD